MSSLVDDQYANPGHSVDQTPVRQRVEARRMQKDQIYGAIRVAEIQV